LSDYLDELEEVVEVDESTGKITLEYSYHYVGKLGVYTEMCCGSSLILQDVRGSGLKWAAFIKGSEYIRIFDDESSVVWEGWLVGDIEKMMISPHEIFIPMDVDEDQWKEWFDKRCRAEVYTNCPVLAEEKIDDYFN